MKAARLLQKRPAPISTGLARAKPFARCSSQAGPTNNIGEAGFMIPATGWECLDSETLKARPSGRLHYPELPSASQLPRELFPGSPGATDDSVSSLFSQSIELPHHGQCWWGSSWLQPPLSPGGWDLCSPQTPRALPCLGLLNTREALTAPRSPTVQPSTCTALGTALLLEAAGEGKPLNPRFVLSSEGGIIPSLAPRRDQEPGNEPSGGTKNPLRLRSVPGPRRAGRAADRLPSATCCCTSITSAKIQVNGVHLHYQQTGEGSHAVLLLPGMLGSGQTDFGPQLKSMNKQLFTVVAWDPRGYGKSIPPSRDFPPDFFERDAKDAVDLMQALKFKKFSLLGWSDGGITALIAAAKYPNLIHKLVVWGANASVTQEDVRIYNGIRDVSKWSEKVKKPLEELYGHKYFAETCEAWVDGISRFAENSDGNICQQLLPDIKCPTFIIHGEKDPLVPQAHAEYIHKHIKGSRLLLMPEGKHNLHLRFAKDFNREVENFLH
ncbi:valacyclovir hydrolase [Geospiza fortis]|uniref:Valacyclovir hydrolase n=2 Tax=Thraupidae TaxID=400783 RepID=A0A8N5ETI1_GEOFO|nr:valacyclovir hydrolase [Geospiza fortis]